MGGRDAIVRRLRETARLLELVGENPFRARAYENAARTLEGHVASPEELLEDGRLAELPGIGPGLAAAVAELLTSGRLALAEELERRVPRGLLDLYSLGGLGGKRIRKLADALKVRDLDSLEEACRAGQVAKLPGFGRRLEQELLESISRARRFRERYLLSAAWEAAASVESRLAQVPGILRWERTGSLRRGAETIGDLDFVVLLDASVTEPEPWARGVASFLGARLRQVESQRLCFGLEGGWSLDLHPARTANFGWELVRTTGSPIHVEGLLRRAWERGYTVGGEGWQRNGQPVALPTEEDVYNALALPWLPPELREEFDPEVQATALASRRLIQLEDLRGTFHVHTTWSDGQASLEEMAAAALTRGWHYLGIADHSQGARYAGGLPPARVLAQWEAVQRWNQEHADLDLLRGTESDILQDGRLDYENDLLLGFDFVVVSVHSHFRLARESMTARILRALEHPATTFLGHPTGRLLLQREPYEVDLDEVLEAARMQGVIVELNASPYRLDLDWRHLCNHLRAGGLTAINPDAHSIRGLEDVAFGVAMARKAGARPEQVVNTWPREEIQSYLAARRGKARAGLSVSRQSGADPQ